MEATIAEETSKCISSSKHKVLDNMKLPKLCIWKQQWKGKNESTAANNMAVQSYTWIMETLSADDMA